MAVAYLEVAFGSEAVAADVALERSLTGVRPDVNLQGRIAAEDFTAVATPVLEQLILLATRRVASGRKGAVVAEAQLIGQIRSQEALRRVVQYVLRRPLQHLQRARSFRIRRRFRRLQDRIRKRSARQLRHETRRRERERRRGRRCRFRRCAQFASIFGYFNSLSTIFLIT